MITRYVYLEAPGWWCLQKRPAYLKVLSAESSGKAAHFASVSCRADVAIADRIADERLEGSRARGHFIPCSTCLSFYYISTCTTVLSH
jgi:hypothetical protein